MIAAPARPAFPSRLFRDRTELFAFVGIIDALNGFSERLVTMLRQHDLLGALVGAGGISVVGWFAFYAIATIAREREADAPIRPADHLVAGVMLALAFAPLAAAAGIALAIGGVWLAIGSPAGSRGRRIAALLLALTGPIVVGALFLRLFAPMALRLDAHLAALLAGARVTGNYIYPMGGGEGIYIAPGCSSLHNISLAVLLWATVVQLLRLRVTAGLIATGLLAAVGMAVVNVVRLAAIAYFPAYFHELHEGFGADLIGLASLFVAGAIVFLGVLAAARRQA
jgi:exosortase/archaeosortase family protein